MSFVLKKENTVDWPVKINVPQNGGNFATKQITVTFLLLPVDESTELSNQPGDGDHALLYKVLKGWTDVMDETGEPIEFSDQAMQLLLGIGYVRRALTLAYFKASFGQAQEKN